MTKALTLGLIGLFLLPAAPGDDPAAALQKGIEQYRAGDFEATLLTLDLLTRQLERETPPPADLLSQAYLYLGAAYVGLLQEPPARGKFRRALKYDAALAPAETEFPPRVLRVFEAAKKGKNKAVLYGGGGLGLAAIIGGGALLAGSATAVTASGLVPTPTPTPAPTTTLAASNSLRLEGELTDELAAAAHRDVGTLVVLDNGIELSVGSRGVSELVHVEASLVDVLAAAHTSAAGSGSTVVVVGWRNDCGRCTVPAPGLSSSDCVVSFDDASTKTCTAIFGLQ